MECAGCIYLSMCLMSKRWVSLVYYVEFSCLHHIFYDAPYTTGHIGCLCHYTILFTSRFFSVSCATTGMADLLLRHHPMMEKFIPETGMGKFSVDWFLILLLPTFFPFLLLSGCFYEQSTLYMSAPKIGSVEVGSACCCLFIPFPRKSTPGQDWIQPDGNYSFFLSHEGGCCATVFCFRHREVNSIHVASAAVYRKVEWADLVTVFEEPRFVSNIAVGSSGGHMGTSVRMCMIWSGLH